MNHASLCILAYERPELLKKSLRSLRINTTYPHERILHDDASQNKETIDYIHAQSPDFSWVIMNKGDNMGIGKAMHNCIAVSTGKYIVKLDTDIIYQPGWLEKAVTILETNPDLGALGLFDYRNYDAGDQRFGIIEGRHNCFIVNDFVNSAYIFTRDVWQKYGDAMGDDGWQQHLRKEGLKLAIPIEDLVANVGFGEVNSIYIQNGEAVKFHNSPKIFK